MQPCCHIGCEEVAVYMITGEQGVGYDDTYMCADHVSEYIDEHSKVERVRTWNGR